ncbi:uncharacterized protein LOC114931346 [Nylanderia fulva]|uniref:uncharacterized protein LOC114931346 n=1 Tax=Nylanderia fulva TaxID=613905 RepID=UPI0010FB3204|nr:uncharacterized protein LOC114931346 [Nylanderia fulva]
MPNQGGPDDRVRRLYAGVVNSVGLYGAPVWADEAVATRHIKDVLKRVQRRVAIRVVRGYRTVAHAAASVLVGLPPMDLVARAHKRAYERIKELRGLETVITDRVRGIVRLQARQQMIVEWGEALNHIFSTRSEDRVVGAIRLVIEEWMDRPRGSRMSFHMTQVFSGHGCFGEYLCRIGRERTIQCNHCEDDRDTAQHTLEHCPAWEEKRRVLMEKIGNDLSLSGIVQKMLESEENWKAMVSFYDRVMLQKETTERERERKRDAAMGSGGEPRRKRGRRPPRHLVVDDD